MNRHPSNNPPVQHEGRRDAQQWTETPVPATTPQLTDRWRIAAIVMAAPMAIMLCIFLAVLAWLMLPALFGY